MDEILLDTRAAGVHHESLLFFWRCEWRPLCVYTVIISVLMLLNLGLHQVAGQLAVVVINFACLTLCITPFCAVSRSFKTKCSISKDTREALSHSWCLSDRLLLCVCLHWPKVTANKNKQLEMNLGVLEGSNRLHLLHCIWVVLV